MRNSARQPRDDPDTPDPNQAYCSHFTASEAAVRTVLRDLRLWLNHWDINPDTNGTVELVLAEALNNIVEHAYAGTSGGSVRLDVWKQENGLSVALSDCGKPLPALQLPAGQLPEIDCVKTDLPEGGFGWYLIHRLTEELHYERHGHQNRLCFQIRSNPGNSS